jgi:molybdate transport system substrate-binding protein
MKRFNFIVACLVACLLTSPSAHADELKVAVASNFVPVMKAIKPRFERHSGHKLVLIAGSTGKHYAQIMHGAPFDIFFAADSRRPALLEKNGSGIAGTRFTYATGRIVIWSPRPGYIDKTGTIPDDIRFLAIANPKLAPYGLAARQFLRERGIWIKFRQRLVRGENIAQTYQYVATGNAEVGIIALSQIRLPGKRIAGSYWIVPESLHSPIHQQAIALNKRKVVTEFLAFIKTDGIKRLISQYGYSTR